MPLERMHDARAIIRVAAMKRYMEVMGGLMSALSMRLLNRNPGE
jgi:hypothetical protein